MNEPSAPSLVFLGAVTCRDDSGVTLLDDVSLSLPGGRVVAVYSSTPVDRSCLLKVLAGKAAPSSGVTTFNLPGCPNQRAAYMHADAAIIPELSVFDNLFYGMHAIKKHFPRGRGQKIQHAKSIADDLGIDLQWLASSELLNSEQRLALALVREFILSAPLYCLDEVMDGIDKAVLNRLQKRIASMAESGATVVFSTRQLDEHLEICNEVVILREGRVVFQGSPQRVKPGMVSCLTAVTELTASTVAYAELRRARELSQEPQQFVDAGLELLSWFHHFQPTCCAYTTSQGEAVFRSVNLPEEVHDTIEQQVLERLSSGTGGTVVFPDASHTMRLICLRNSQTKVVAVGFPMLTDKSVLPVQDFCREFIGILVGLIAENEVSLQLRHQQRLGLLGTMAGGICHDLNNSLFAIMGSAEIIAQRNKQPELKTLIQMIMDVTEDTKGLTAKLLSFSKKGSTTHVPEDLHMIIDNALAVANAAVQHEVQILRHFDATNPTVACDALEIQNVVVNLLLNAIYAVQSKGDRIELLTWDYTEATDELDIDGIPLPVPSVVLTVRDNGPGIPAFAVGRIFEPFYTTRPEGRGTGLGLSVVYGTMKEHGGGIRLSTSAKEGTAFSLYFPSRMEASITKSHPEKHGSFKGQILICDDNHHVREVMGSMIELLGYQPVLTSSARECLQVFQGTPLGFDLVIVDDIMPGMSGQECFFELKKILPEVKVIIVTGLRANQNLRALYEAGLQGFYRKPLSLDTLEEVLAQHCQGPQDPPSAAVEA